MKSPAAPIHVSPCNFKLRQVSEQEPVRRDRTLAYSHPQPTLANDPQRLFTLAFESSAQHAEGSYPL